MAGTYRGVLACSAGSLRHGILDRIFNGKEKANSAIFPRMVEQTGSSFRNSIFEKALEASITCNLLGICIIRMIPKPSQNGSAFYQKKPSKSRPGGTKIEVWRALGQVWRRLGPSWAILDVFGSVLDRLGSVFEASWKPPGPFWVEKGCQHGCKLAPKTEPKSIKNRSQNRSIV